MAMPGQGLGDLPPMATFVNRRTDDEIGTLLDAADAVPQPEGPVTNPAAYAKGVSDTIAWLFGMSVERPAV